MVNYIATNAINIYLSVNLKEATKLVEQNIEYISIYMSVQKITSLITSKDTRMIANSFLESIFEDKLEFGNDETDR